jgi:glucose-1-phosphatase
LCLIARAPFTVGTDFVCADLMISIIIFDMNDVLYSYDRSVRIAHIARICVEPAAAVAEAIWESGFEDRGDSGVMDADAYLSGFGERAWASH